MNQQKPLDNQNLASQIYPNPDNFDTNKPKEQKKQNKKHFCLIIFFIILGFILLFVLIALVRNLIVTKTYSYSTNGTILFSFKYSIDKYSVDENGNTISIKSKQVCALFEQFIYPDCIYRGNNSVFTIIKIFQQDDPGYLSEEKLSKYHKKTLGQYTYYCKDLIFGEDKRCSDESYILKNNFELSVSGFEIPNVQKFVKTFKFEQ